MSHLTELESVTLYINDNVYHSQAFDIADERLRYKAINNAKKQLIANLPRFYKSEGEIPVADIAEQAVWLMRVNDLMLNAEQGATSIALEGINIKFSEVNRTIAPSVLQRHGMSGGVIRRVGRYQVLGQDTNRRGCTRCTHS